MLISEEQVSKAVDEVEGAMDLIKQHVKDENALKAIRRKLMLSILAIVPDAYNPPAKAK